MVVGSGRVVRERGLRKARTVCDCEGCGGRAVVYIPTGGGGFAMTGLDS